MKLYKWRINLVLKLICICSGWCSLSNAVTAGDLEYSGLAQELRIALQVSPNHALLLAPPGTVLSTPSEQRDSSASPLWEALDQIPDQDPVFFYDSSLRASSLYGAVLASEAFSDDGKEMNGGAEIDRARALLYGNRTSDLNSLEIPSAAYDKYLKYEDTDFRLQEILLSLPPIPDVTKPHNEKISNTLTQQEIDSLLRKTLREMLAELDVRDLQNEIRHQIDSNELEWELFGRKQSIEAAVATILRSDERAREVWWRGLEKIFKSSKVSRADGSSNPMTLAEPPPSDWYSEQGWAEIRVGPAANGIKMQVKRIRIMRPWLETALLQFPKWTVYPTSIIGFAYPISTVGVQNTRVRMPVELVLFRKAEFEKPDLKSKFPQLNTANNDLPSLLAWDCIYLPDIVVDSSNNAKSKRLRH
ncbi:MAG TPA: hypothetical protein VKV04_10820 [Verrucomicrobiae bacterium]|nr:hypothetical protein [Verrucomicrobiae bacterium]